MRGLLRALILLVCFFSLPAFAQEGQPRYAFFPEFFSGNGWICEIFFTNQDIIGVPGINIAFYDFTGTPASISSNLGDANNYTFDLGRGATQIIQVDPEAPFVEGYAVITYPPPGGSPVRATVVYRLEDSRGNVVAEFGVPQQEFGCHFSFPVEMDMDFSKRISTAVAVANPDIFGSRPENTVIFDLIGTDGEIDATAKVPLAPGQHFADYLNQETLFETFFSGLDYYIGSLSISSPFGVGIMGIRQDKNAFGAISTDYGPILGPFASGINDLDSDQEPNDSFVQAQLINGSTLISGTIGAQNDKDYFAITGQQGDVLSVICDAQLQGSWLDSLLEIYNSAEELIAVNDQNGLSPELYPVNDSFIQVELPANDTYYIVLKDYFNDGDQDFFYDLYVKLTPGN